MSSIQMGKPENPLVGELWLEESYGEVYLVRMLEEGPHRVSSVFSKVRPTSETQPVETTHLHVHRDPDGLLHRCYHKCKSVLSWQFFAGLTLSFPIEHALWTKVPPFAALAEFLGLGIGHH